MSRTFEIPKCPYDGDERIYLHSEITLNPGVTVLAGCNGSGKTTLLGLLKDQLEDLNIPYISYSNLSDGGSTSLSKQLMYNNITKLATLAVSSEGEQVSLNVAYFASDLGKFIRKHRDDKELYILFDAIDSGLSIDNIIDIKECLFNTILEDTKGMDVYIIVSANTFEMCFNEQCLDVWTGKYREFKAYNSYKNFILKSREYKDKRYAMIGK